MSMFLLTEGVSWHEHPAVFITSDRHCGDDFLHRALLLLAL